MVKEVVTFLEPAPGKVLVDCTLGFGGHAAALLDKGANVIGFDRDQTAIEAAKGRLSDYRNIRYIKGNFGDLKELIKEKVDGFLFDLGVSSYQIDNAERGFSIRTDGPLDMRMDKSARLTAAEIVNHYSEEELAKIFFEYGEERFSRRVARAIVVAREPASKPRGSQEPRRLASGSIKSTQELKELIEKAIPTWRKRESVSRIFQALRIAVNSELSNLKAALPQAFGLLIPGGRIVVISYHSLEDRIVKQAFKNGILKMLTKKPVTPGVEETAQNPRARSAKLRAAEKK